MPQQVRRSDGILVMASSLRSQYRSYLKANGVKANALEVNPFVMTESQFAMYVQANMTVEQKIDEMYARLEAINEAWYSHLVKGADDKNPLNDAYHCRVNAANLVDQIRKLQGKPVY
jgi:hypothetical protein